MELAAALEKLPKQYYPNVLVGFNTSDDAGVVLLDDKTGLVHTVDFFTPIVDDPFAYGQIAAANSLSDVYAMGGKPVSALNVVGFPRELFSIDVLSEILRGGLVKAMEAETPIVGGHTIADSELKYGLSVTGLVDPKKMMTNSAAEAGDVLLLTKPLGTGTITTALKAGKGSPKMEKYVVEVMARLNRDAAQVAVFMGVRACTDITGFGLLGHLLEMASSSGAGIIVEYDKVPFLQFAEEYTRRGFVPGGTRANLLHVSPNVTFAERFSDVEKLLLCDPQTSGGLVMAVHEDKVKETKTRLTDTGIIAWAIGYVTADFSGKIIVK
ncbi:selenide, water dikinase SelD [candidate division KSB1 bacterium]|nr:selenide, water dikinase SelD [candidate division KSB1 bacterium]